MAGGLIAIVLVGWVVESTQDNFERGTYWLEKKDYVRAKRYLEKVPSAHPKFNEAMAMLDEQTGSVGIALHFQGRAELEAKLENDRAIQEQSDKRAKAATAREHDEKAKNVSVKAQLSCQRAALKAARWEGAERDFVPSSDVSSIEGGLLRVTGRDVQWPNGLGAKGYIDYVGVYDPKNENCSLVSAGF